MKVITAFFLGGLWRRASLNPVPQLNSLPIVEKKKNRKKNKKKKENEYQTDSQMKLEGVQTTTYHLVTCRANHPSFPIEEIIRGMDEY